MSDRPFGAGPSGASSAAASAVGARAASEPANAAPEEPTSVRPSLTAELVSASSSPERRERSTAPGWGPSPKSAPSAGEAGPRAPNERDTDQDLLARDIDLEELSQGGPRVSFASLTKASAIGRFGAYQLLGRIAFGGMAEIFLAREGAEGGRGGRFVIVKRVLPHVAADAQFIAMFKDEARLAMQLSHPNICHVYAFGQETSAYFIAMEWVNGMPLSKVIRRARDTGGLSVPIVMKIVAVVAEALDYAHRAADQTTGEPLGIVHRDVSPQNVMVSYDGIVKLLDFGIAKASSHSTRTEAGVVKGKFAYMAPEQCLGEPIDARADVFALGVCLYELLDGKNPFKRQTEFDTMRALVYEEPPALSELHPHIPLELDAIVKRATAKRREDRYQSAADLQLALEQALARTGEIVPTSRVAERMGELFANEIKAGPRLDTRVDVPRREPHDPAGESDRSLAQVVLPPNATERMPIVTDDAARSTLEPEPRRRSLALVASLVLALLLVGGAGVFAAFFTGVVTLGPPRQDGSGGASAPSRDHGPAIGPAPLAPPAAPAPTTTGTLLVDSTPSGASVALGDRGIVGTTPLEVGRLEAGEWPLHLSLGGYEDWDSSVEVRAGEHTRVTGTLVAIEASAPRAPSREGRRDRSERAEQPERAAAASGELSINTRPWSRVYVGQRLLGTTPIGNVELPAGSVRLRLVDRDGGEHTRTVIIPPDGQAREFFDLSTDPE